MKRKFPNLFIVGAPKCGTTSLAIWLSEHPQIFFYIGKNQSTKVEPHYWSSDIKIGTKMSPGEYFHIFNSIIGNYKYMGEASPSYLYSKVALENIEKSIEEPKYILLIRNPIEMAYSIWRFNFAMGMEGIDDFISAFELSEDRLKGNPVGITFLGKFQYESKLFSYKYVCSLGTHLENLLNIVDKERVLILVLEDIKKNPRKEWLKTLAFLELEDDGRKNFTVYNEGKIPRNKILFKIYNKIKELIYLTKPIRKKLGLYRTGIISKVDLIFLSSIKGQNKQIPKYIKAYLLEHFREEIEKLENILNREFKDWKQI